jgi:hypothetical protein
MKALSIKQPWTYAILHLGKRIENRTWAPPASVIGQTIALHASAKDDQAGYRDVFQIAGVRVGRDVTRGAVVATAKVIGWIDQRGNFSVPSNYPILALDGKWFFGPIGWILDDIKPLDQPIPAKGALGLWEWKTDY